jgi:hypothetical protein
MQTHSCTLISMLLIHSFYRGIPCQAAGIHRGVAFCKISSFDPVTEQRAKERRRRAVRPPSGRNSPYGCPLNLRGSAWVSTSSRWVTVHASCLATIGACNFRALIAEKRAKETRDAPANRLEITARLHFNFALVRLESVE